MEKSSENLGNRKEGEKGIARGGVNGTTTLSREWSSPAERSEGGENWTVDGGELKMGGLSKKELKSQKV